MVYVNEDEVSDYFDEWALTTQKGEKSITKEKINKAQYDKSYPVKILGVDNKFLTCTLADDDDPDIQRRKNKPATPGTYSPKIKKLTDGLTAEEQEQIIAAYGIPEELDDGEPHYYTFDIHGGHYVVRSTADFNLGEQATVRIPNGVWSDMYLEVSKGTGGDGNYVPYTFVQTEEPVTDEETGVVVNESDYWIEIDNTTNKRALRLYQYVPDDESETGYSWKMQHKYGVGEDIGDHNERFNDYENNTASGGDYNHVIGQRNSVSGTGVFAGGYNNRNSGSSSSYSIIYGNNNTNVGSLFSSLLIGTGITLNASNYSWISGSSHTIGGTISNCAVSGDSNKIYASTTGSIVSGYNNIITNETSHSIITGSGNTGTGPLAYCIVGGSGNKAGSAYQSLIIGKDNILYINYAIDQSIISGNENTQTGAISGSIVAGSHNNVSATNALVAGVYGEVASSSYINIGGGTSSARANIFVVTNSGDVQAAGTYDTIGADYAEYFEWADGNPDGEDRRGMLVSLDGDRLIPAHGDDILGAVSAVPSVIGNSADEHWRGRYKTDVFGCEILGEDGKPILSDDYDPEKKYISRAKRPEWAAVGLVGRLIVTDNGKCQVEKPIIAQNGVAVPALRVIGENSTYAHNIRMLKRIDKNHIEILIR